jgi:pyruvate dehydrogenase E1 component alpha subunit
VSRAAVRVAPPEQALPEVPWPPIPDAAPFLPSAEPLRVLGTPLAARLDPALALRLHRDLVLARRLNRQAAALARQGALVVYSSSEGQEACQVAAAAVLESCDWLFPTYRDVPAVILRGVEPVEALTLLRGSWHSGYDPLAHRVAPLSVPLATHCPHAVGLAHAARLSGERLVALALIGDGATSEGDFHEALNFAAVWKAPVVFLVQNNRYAISVPLRDQSAAPALAYKGVGYGIPSYLVDGNDALAVHQVLTQAVAHARGGRGPVLVEALTYRVEPHTNADDPTRYRDQDEESAWRRHDPITLLERHLQEAGLLDASAAGEAAAAADLAARRLREAMADRTPGDPLEMFDFVYDAPPARLAAQRAELAHLLGARR